MTTARPRRLLAAATLAAATTLGALLMPSAPAGATPTLATPEPPRSVDVCDTVRTGHARCLARVRVDAPVRAASARATASGALTPPPGYGAAELRAAYRIADSTAHPTVAVVIAYDVPNAEADLGVYRRTMGLPPCTRATGCFRKVNQNGAATPLPPPDSGWALEASMDLQMVSAACPSCRLLLVVGEDSSLLSLSVATRTAARLGASLASHSYGADEGGWVAEVSAPYTNPRMPSVASSGDWGFTTASFPAVLREVTAVGGTTLRTAPTPRGWRESVWSGAGSGCSAWVDKPAYQHDGNCAMRTVADVSAVADPETGVAVYDSFPTPWGEPGWFVLGGTSASAPLVAGMVAAAGSPATWRPGLAYARAARFTDVRSGSNGTCGGDYLCTGLPGYDAPSGVGTPRGLWAFRAR